MTIEIESSDLLQRLTAVAETLRYCTMPAPGYAMQHAAAMVLADEVISLVRDAVLDARYAEDKTHCV